MEIPVTFSFRNKDYHGYFSRVAGSGGTSTFDLSVDNFHWGQLFYAAGHPGFNGLHVIECGWRFYSTPHPELSELAEFFGMVVTAWVDSHS